jgi:hypothetical protein
VKLVCYRVGKGWFPPPGYQDNIILNRRTSTLKLMVSGRVEAVLMPLPIAGSQPKLGHIARALMPRRFYVQLNHFHMLVVPSWFQDTLRKWIKTLLPHSASF